MIDKFLTKVFGSSNQRYLKTLLPLVTRINELEPSVKALSDDQMRARVAELREQVAREIVNALVTQVRGGAQVQRFNLDGTPSTTQPPQAQQPQ